MRCTELQRAVKDVLTFCELSTDKKVIDLLVGTACVESECGKYIKQVNGPACGIFQMEPVTANDIYENYIKYKENYKTIYDILFNKYFTIEQNLMYNLAFSIFMCRMHYMRIKEKIPETFDEQAKYWKKYYNTKLGKGTEQDYILKGKTYGYF